MVTQSIYHEIIRKDFILKTLPNIVERIPTINKLEVRIIFPKIIDDFNQLYDGVLYLEELTGHLPVNKILSTKRVGAHEYEKTVVITSTLRKEYFWDFLLFFSIALIYFWIDMRSVLVMSSSIDPQNKIIQLIHKDFFYFFNMPIEYDDRQFQWHLQFLFHFEEENENISIELLSCFLKYYFFYDILALPVSSNLYEIASEDQSEDQSDVESDVELDEELIIDTKNNISNNNNYSSSNDSSSDDHSSDDSSDDDYSDNDHIDKYETDDDACIERINNLLNNSEKENLDEEILEDENLEESFEFFYEEEEEPKYKKNEGKN